MVMMAILSICRIIFHGLRPLALYFSHGLMKKYFSFLLKFSTNWGSACDFSVLFHSQWLFEARHENGSPSVICANSLSPDWRHTHATLTLFYIWGTEDVVLQFQTGRTRAHLHVEFSISADECWNQIKSHFLNHCTVEPMMCRRESRLNSIHLSVTVCECGWNI